MNTALFKTRRGAALGEYALLAGLVCLVAIPSIARLGQANKDLFEGISNYVGAAMDGDLASGSGVVYVSILYDTPAQNARGSVANPYPGDIPGDTSTQWQLGLDSSATHEFEFGGDHDWWRVETQAERSTLQFTLDPEDLSGPEGAAELMELVLRDDQGEALHTMRYGSAPARVVNDLPPGIYYLDVASRNSSSLGGYRVAATEIFDLSYGIDGTNLDVVFGDWMASEIERGDTGDAWSLALSERTDVLFEVASPNSSFNAEIDLLDAEGNMITGFTKGGSSQAFLVNGMDAGQYYPRIRSVNASAPYDFRVRLVEDLPDAAAVRSGAEPNRFAIGEVAASELFPGESGDMHAFEVTQAGSNIRVELNTDGYSANLYLYDTDATTQLDYSYWSGRVAVEASNLDPGTYYVLVARRNSSSNGDYNLTAAPPPSEGRDMNTLHPAPCVGPDAGEIAPTSLPFPDLRRRRPAWKNARPHSSSRSLSRMFEPPFKARSSG